MNNHNHNYSVYQKLKSVYDELSYIDKRDETKITMMIDKINKKLRS